MAQAQQQDRAEPARGRG